MRESSGKRIGLPVDGEISISKNTEHPNLASSSSQLTRTSPKTIPLIYMAPVLILSPFSLHLRAPFFTVHANLCTAIQIYFHDCQVKFKFMPALLFMNVSRAWKHFAYVISGNFVVCAINSAIISDAKKIVTYSQEMEFPQLRTIIENVVLIRTRNRISAIKNCNID